MPLYPLSLRYIYFCLIIVLLSLPLIPAMAAPERFIAFGEHGELAFLDINGNVLQQGEISTDTMITHVLPLENGTLLAGDRAGRVFYSEDSYNWQQASYLDSIPPQPGRDPLWLRGLYYREGRVFATLQWNSPNAAHASDQSASSHTYRSILIYSEDNGRTFQHQETTEGCNVQNATAHLTWWRSGNIYSPAHLQVDNAEPVLLPEENNTLINSIIYIPTNDGGSLHLVAAGDIHGSTQDSDFTPLQYSTNGADWQPTELEEVTDDNLYPFHKLLHRGAFLFALSVMDEQPLWFSVDNGKTMHRITLPNVFISDVAVTDSGAWVAVGDRILADGSKQSVWLLSRDNGVNWSITPLPFIVSILQQLPNTSEIALPGKGTAKLP